MTTYKLSAATSLKVRDYVQITQVKECENTLYLEADILDKTFLLKEEIQPFIDAKKDGLFCIKERYCVVVSIYRNKLYIGFREYALLGQVMFFTVKEWSKLMLYIPAILCDAKLGVEHVSNVIANCVTRRVNALKHVRDLNDFMVNNTSTHVNVLKHTSTM